MSGDSTSAKVNFHFKRHYEFSGDEPDMRVKLRRQRDGERGPTYSLQIGEEYGSEATFFISREQLVQIIEQLAEQAEEVLNEFSAGV